MYSCNNAVLIVSALIDSGATHSFISKPLVQKLQLPLIFGLKLAVTLANGLDLPVRRMSLLPMALYCRMLNKLVSG